ncbi:MAG: hypothetical protein ABSH00_02680 [Bryobacteraceae bacterium]|jgi:hypothetical protein
MRTLILSAALAALSVPIWAAAADTVNADEIIRKFAAKEAEFAEARGNYTYRQSLKMEELDPGGNPTGGKWEEIDDIIFTPEGKRIEKVVYAPVISLKNIGLTPEDVQDLREVQPFVLTTAALPEYDINYLGKEKIDEIDCYLFSVKPKKLLPHKRYFEGEVWVDDRDLQIVKTYGKGVGIAKNQEFPKFETYREQIDGKYWFPTYTHADDTLRFKDMSQRIRMVVKYQDYKRFEGKSTIKYGETVDNSKTPTTKK